jgi:hypothetical protein
MILFFGGGEIGNKLFQYVGLKKYFPKEKLIFFGRQNFFLIFKNINVKFIITKKYIFFFYLLKKLIFFFSKIRLLGLIYEDSSRKNLKIHIKNGLFWWIKVATNIYFQHTDFVKQIDNPLILKSEIIKKGFQWFDKKKINLKKNKIVFVQIRRGDYLHWPSKKFPGALDINWYKKAMSLIKKKFKSPIFILMSDDKEYLHALFKENNSIIISDNKAEMDISIMSVCNAGILSASSFGWWGAFFAKTLYKNNSYFIAPNYWLGYKKEKWFPDNFYTNWITYL